MDVAVSVVVPCYNVEPYLADCLKGLSGQELKEMEIICVDDGSTDGTPDVLHQWASRDSRIRVIHQSNAGVSCARNAGLSAACGEYIGFADPDDIVDAAMFGHLLGLARKYDADVVECGYEAFLDKDGSLLEEWSYKPTAGWYPEETLNRFGRHSVWGRMMGPVWNKLFRRKLLEKYRVRFIPGVSQGEDVAFLLMTVPLACRVAASSGCFYHYRCQRKGSITYERLINSHDFNMDLASLHEIAHFWRRHHFLNSETAHGLADYFMEYLRKYFMVRGNAFSAANEDERLSLLEGWKDCLELVGGEESLVRLDKWERAFCRLLLEYPLKGNRFLSWYFHLMSGCRGRRGAYYNMKRQLLSMERTQCCRSVSGKGSQKIEGSALFRGGDGPSTLM